MTILPTNSTSDHREPEPSNHTSLPPWLIQVRGLAQSDLASLVGRQRLAQALDLEQKPDNRYLRLSLYFLGGAVALFLPLAALIPITQVVQASGEVVPEGAVNVVQHLEGGIVSKVNVRDGQKVTVGQVLLELNPKLVGSEYEAGQQKLQNLLLQQKQLQSAIRGDLTLEDVRDTGKTNKVTEAQQQLLTSRLINRGDQLAASLAIVQQKKAEVEGLNEQISYQRQQVVMWESLQQSGGASKLQLLQTKTHLAELKGARNEAQKALSQAEANFHGLQSGMNLEQNSQIAELVSEEAVVAESIKKVRNQLDRTKITAPVSGVISDLRYKAPGSVVAPGAVVLQVVPSGTDQSVEVKVPSKDIGFVKVGQPVDVKLQPFDSSMYGSVPGKVMSVAGTTVQDPDTRQYYYLARLQLDRQFVDARHKKYAIQPGMPLIADIKGQSKSLLRYLLQPFTRTLDSAFEESR